MESILESYPGISDKEVVRIALENELIILTFDRDYGEIVFRYSDDKKPAVIYFKEKIQTPMASAEALIGLIKEGISFEHRFTVLEHSTLRQKLY